MRKLKGGLKGLQIKFSAKEIAIVNLQSNLSEIENDKNVHQVTFNIVTYRLRIYLGEASKIYESFAKIDISIQDGKRGERIENAIRLINAAINMIDQNGLYEDLQTQLLRLNIRDAKNRTLYLIGGAIGGAVLTNLKGIYHFLQSLVQGIHK
jgi:hypothetical protein